MDTNKAFVLKAASMLRTGTVNEVDTHCYLGEFEKFQYSVDEQNRQWNEREALVAAAERRDRRENLLQHEREKKANTTQTMNDITSRWMGTQQIKQDRVKTDVQFELTLQKIQELKTQHRRQQATLDERNGIEFYENNLKKMGISSGDSDNVRMSISYEAQDLFQKRLETNLAAKLPTNEEVQSFVNQLKDRTAEKRAARYEKARRRRRALTTIAQESSQGVDAH